jgi:hypothetical protein
MRRTTCLCLSSGLLFMVVLAATSSQVRATPVPTEKTCTNCTCVIWQDWVWKDGETTHYGRNRQLQGATWVNCVNAYPAVGDASAAYWVKAAGAECNQFPVGGGAPPGNPVPVPYVQAYTSGSKACDLEHSPYMSGKDFADPLDDPTEVEWWTCAGT